MSSYPILLSYLTILYYYRILLCLGAVCISFGVFLLIMDQVNLPWVVTFLGTDISTEFEDVYITGK